jgi:hypothetical protein
MKDFGTLSYFLGLEISSSSDGFYLAQAKYISDLLFWANLTNCKTVDTPTELNVCLNLQDGEPLCDPTLYRHLVGSLVYLTVARPDISYVVHQVSQFMAAPRSPHFSAVLRILHYLKGKLFHRLHFSSQSPLELHAYTDADWAGDPTKRRSTTSYCFLLGTSLFLGAVRNSLLLLAPALRQNIVLQLTPSQSSFGYDGFYKIWMSLFLQLLLSTVTIKVLFRLPIMMFFMNGSTILRLIVTFSVIIFFMALYNFILSRLMINSRTSSQSLILQGDFTILCPTSRWSLALHIEFKRGGGELDYVCIVPHGLLCLCVCSVPHGLLMYSYVITNLYI